MTGDLCFLVGLIQFWHPHAGIAQLARALPCQGRGREFESRCPLSSLPICCKRGLALASPLLSFRQDKFRYRLCCDQLAKFYFLAFFIAALTAAFALLTRSVNSEDSSLSINSASEIPSTKFPRIVALLNSILSFVFESLLKVDGL